MGLPPSALGGPPDRRVYLDHAASTPLDPAALAAMRPFLAERFANPAARYRSARDAAEAVERARATVAALLECRPAEVAFTSGGTESINLALRGIALAQMLAGTARHIVTTAIEHDAVLRTVQALERFGITHTIVDPGAEGIVSPDAVARALRPDTALVSIMLANNEVGTIQPVAETVEAVRQRGRALRRRMFVHLDAVQGPGLLPVAVARLGVDALSLSAHKFYGPKGGGVLVLRRGLPYLEQLTGGGQEHQRRAGTQNVAAVVGTAVALERAESLRAQVTCHCAALQERMRESIRERLPDARLNGDPARMLPTHVNLSIPDIDGERLVEVLDEHGVEASSGSACESTSREPSHVLLAMGLPVELAVGAVRFTLGRETTDADVDYALQILPHIVEHLRTVSRAG